LNIALDADGVLPRRGELEFDADECEEVSEGLVDFLMITVKNANAVAKCVECCR
jgi:hypothetical protein